MFAQALAGTDINIDNFGYAARRLLVLSGLDRAIAIFDQCRASEGDHGLWGLFIVPSCPPSCRPQPLDSPGVARSTRGNKVDGGSITRSRALIAFGIVGTRIRDRRHVQPCSHAAEETPRLIFVECGYYSHAPHRAEQLGRKVDRQKPNVPFKTPTPPPDSGALKASRKFTSPALHSTIYVALCSP